MRLAKELFVGNAVRATAAVKAGGHTQKRCYILTALSFWSIL